MRVYQLIENKYELSRARVRTCACVCVRVRFLDQCVIGIAPSRIIWSVYRQIYLREEKSIGSKTNSELVVEYAEAVKDN